MTRDELTSWDENQGHPTEGKLLLLLDGELPSKEAQLLRVHLEACWACRMSAEKIQETIFAFVDYRDRVMRPLAAPPPSDGRSFEGRLERLSAGLNRRSLLSYLLGLLSRLFATARAFSFSRRPVWVAALLAIALGAPALLSWLNSAPVVSASELLQRSTETQARQIRATAQPVVYQKLLVKRKAGSTAREETVIWETWNDKTNPRFRQSVDRGQGRHFIAQKIGSGAEPRQPAAAREEITSPAILMELDQALRANRLDPQQPLSPASFQRWRQSLTRRVEEVTRSQAAGGGEILTLRIAPTGAVAAGQITEATLVVRASDWHTIAERLRVQGESEARDYELSELAYQVLPLQSLTVFTDVAPASPTTVLPAVSPTSLLVAPAPSPKATTTEVALKDAEVAALYALHQAQADLGEQIEVVRDPAGKMVVRGLVETEARKQQLAEALRNIPLITTRIQTVEEAARQAALQQSARAAQTAPVDEPVNAVTPGAPARNAFEQRLVKYFAELESSTSASDRRAIDLKIAQLSNEVVSESSAALSESWALRRLLERYAAESELSPTARQRIEEMSANHVARLKAQSRKLRALLEPALISMAGGDPVVSAPAPAESTKQAQALVLFRAVEQAQQLAHRLFAGAGADSAPEAAARQLLESLARLDQALHNFEQVISK